MKKLLIPTFSFLLTFLIASKAYAFCPVCTVAVAGGVGLSRWLGVDDLITGLWVGGLVISATMWTVNWFAKKGLNSLLYKTMIFLAFIALTILPLYKYEILGHPQNRIWGVDKLALGIGSGLVLFWVFEWLSLKFKNKKGKVYFPFQKVIVPIVLLAIVSVLVYFIIIK